MSTREAFPYNSPMNETDPAIIDAQIAAGIATRETALDFCGNLVASLPGGMYRHIVETNKWFDRRVVEPDEADGTYPFSERARSTTWQAFFKDIDQATAQSGLSPAQLEQFRQAHLNHELGDEPFTTLDYAIATLPIYRQLRIMGYSHNDLQR